MSCCIRSPLVKLNGVGQCHEFLRSFHFRYVMHGYAAIIYLVPRAHMYSSLAVSSFIGDECQNLSLLLTLCLKYTSFAYRMGETHR